MNYRMDRHGNALSILGYGCMRFPRKMGMIDMKATEEQVLLAYKNGVNYFDTAYIYPGSEAALGEILSKNNIRQQVNIATKLPQSFIKDKKSIETIFQEELSRLQTDYVDYYLMHMLSDVDAWKRLVDMGILQWLEEKKAAGKIRQIGFSYHGNTDEFCKLIDAYDWDFCQIQYNYMDEHSQAGRKGLQYANSKGIPVIIMEPLRGGKLVSKLPEEAKKIFGSYPVRKTPAQWAFTWLWDQPEVTVVLSGMNSNAMIEENVQTASQVTVGCLNQDDDAMLKSVVAAINAKLKVGCTGCGYCMPCPKGVDIPGTFAAYNRCYSEGKLSAFREYLQCTAMRKNATCASNCVGCGKCEKHCPQGIPIREKLNEAKKELETPAFAIAFRVIKKFTHR